MSTASLRARVGTPWGSGLLLGALSVALGLITLGSKALWFDEAYDAHDITRGWAALFANIGRTEMSQAAYLVVLKSWGAVGPASELWLRLPSVLFAALAVTLLVPLTTRLFDLTTGIVAGILLATNEMLVSWAQQARTYALVTVAVVLSTYLFVRALDEPTRTRWVVYGVIAGASVYCHFYAGFVVAAQFLSIPFAPRRPPWRRVVEAAAIIAVAGVVALHFVATASTDQYSWLGKPTLRVVQHILETTAGSNNVFAITVVAGLALLAFRATANGGTAPFLLVLVAGWIGMPILLARLVSLHQPIMVDRYMIVITPALAIAASVFFIALFRGPRYVAALGVLALASVVVVSGVRIATWYRSTPEDWRGAIAFLHDVRKPGDAVYLAPRWTTAAFRFYDPTTDITREVPKGRTYVVVRASEGSDPGAEINLAMGTESGLGQVWQRQFGRRVFVVLLEPTKP